jgi:tetratricopeptide (TPR) repeat protein
MIEMIIIIGAWFMLRRQLSALEQPAAGTPVLAPKRANPQLVQLTAYADRLYAERKWRDAEKSYLSLLKLDHKNVTAYAHLGIIYSTQKNMPDAIECFTIAARLRPSGSSLQNLALAFYDNHNYIKSIATYEKAIMFEPHAQRYTGLGKAHAKLHNLPAAISAYEQAVELDPTKRSLQRLAKAYEEADRAKEAATTYRRILELDNTDPDAMRFLSASHKGA